LQTKEQSRKGGNEKEGVQRAIQESWKRKSPSECEVKKRGKVRKNVDDKEKLMRVKLFAGIRSVIFPSNLQVTRGEGKTGTCEI